MYATLLHDKGRGGGSKARLARAAASVALSVLAAGVAGAANLDPPSTKSAPALPDANDFWSRPYLLGDWGGERSYLHALGIDVTLSGVNETIGNTSGGYRNFVGEASQFTLGANFDLQKLAGWQGGTIGLTLTDRFGQNQAAMAGIQTLMLTNEVWGRGDIVRLTEFYFEQKLFDDILQIKVGRLPAGSDFFFQHCDFMNLGLCGGQPGWVMSDYIYNWPVSQWGGVVKVNLTQLVAVQVGVYDQNPDYLDLAPLYALLPTFPPHSLGALIPVELQWKPVWGSLQPGDYRFGGWYSTESANNVVTSVNGLPTLISGLPPMVDHGRSGLYFSLLQPLTGDPAGRDPKHGLSAFVNGTFGDPKTSMIENQVNVALIQHGTFDWRPSDEVAIGYSETHVNSRIAAAQTLANALGIGRVTSSIPKASSRPGTAFRSPAG